MKTTLSVVTPFGTFTRTTARTYTHLVIGTDRKTGEVCAIGFSGSFKLAVSLRKQWSVGKKWDLATNRWVSAPSPFTDLRVYSVDGQEVL